MVTALDVYKRQLVEGVKAVDLFVDNAAVFASKGEMRKLVQGGGVSLNKEKLAAFDQVITTAEMCIRDRDGNAILFTTERYGMRAHASWGSQNDAMLVFLNQDAFDKFRLSKEDYELQKELEKEQQKDKEKSSIDPKKDKKKDRCV